MHLLNSKITVIIPTIAPIMSRRDTTTPATAPPTSSLTSSATVVSGDDGKEPVLSVVLGIIAVDSDVSGGTLDEAILFPSIQIYYGYY